MSVFPYGVRTAQRGGARKWVMPEFRKTKASGSLSHLRIRTPNALVCSNVVLIEDLSEFEILGFSVCEEFWINEVSGMIREIRKSFVVK